MLHRGSELSVFARDYGMNKSSDTYSDDNPRPPGRNRELLWEHRQHPNDLVLFDCYPTTFPGTWVAIVEDRLPLDQIHALNMEGFMLYQVRFLENKRAQIIIREEARPDRDGAVVHEKTTERYEQYDRREIELE